MLERRTAIRDAAQPAASPARGELFYVKGATLFVARDGRETRLSEGQVPATNREGVYFMSGPGMDRAYFAPAGGASRPMGIAGFDDVVPSPSGERLLLTKWANGQIRKLYLYDVAARRRGPNILPANFEAHDPSWVSEERVLMGGTSRAGSPTTNIYSITVPATGAKFSRPTLVLADHYGPALSPGGDYLACLKRVRMSGPDSDAGPPGVVSLVVFRMRGLKRVAEKRPRKPYSGFSAPIAWVGEDSLAVTYYRAVGWPHPDIWVLRMVPRP